MERVLRNSSGGRAVILLAAIAAMAIVGIKVVLVNSNDYMSSKNGLSGISTP
ncbi:hypothetical protein [Pyrodictium abyssi]|uniref:Uncharacterized protein n=1 Tax=Pyrodictium abyssi TaxID=54256 RepID=A0ABM8IW66_9CREN|nr:hypothetical protein PABY_13710 [Pyrodictium abyssi]